MSYAIKIRFLIDTNGHKTSVRKCLFPNCVCQLWSKNVEIKKNVFPFLIVVTMDKKNFSAPLPPRNFTVLLVHWLSGVNKFVTPEGRIVAKINKDVDS